MMSVLPTAAAAPPQIIARPWRRLARTTLIGAGWTVGMGCLFLFTQGWPRGAGWHWFALYWGRTAAISFSITYTIHALFVLLYWLLGHERVGRLAPRHRFALFASLAMLGAAIGWPIGLTLIGQDFLQLLQRHPETVGVFLTICLIATLAQGFIYFNRTAKLRAEQQATEAQLRLLQGQIEPHFLFNTLANVLSLMELQPDAARRMLETFVDYLRGSLGRLRTEDCTLGDELALVQAYLALLQMRMGERLRFTIDADAGARRAVLPPMLLQPLVENAVHHGLEPKLDGGCVRVTARHQGAQLTIEVRDDGLGPAAAAARRRSTSNGMALHNIRERLRMRYGDAASLSLAPAEPGMIARLTLPFETSAAALVATTA
jgi:two-component sensor histidine kinase